MDDINKVMLEQHVKQLRATKCFLEEQINNLNFQINLFEEQVAQQKT